MSELTANSTIFERACDLIEARTDLDRIETRGTVRIALKESGLEPASLGATQMAVVLRKVLPAELDVRGIKDSAAVCEAVAVEIERLATDGPVDRASAAAGTFGRFGH